MKRAFISDIHGNADALKKVFEDIDSLQVDEVICLGDIVGYGPEPDLCTEMVMDRARVTIKGNHDYALIYGPTGFNQIAAEAIRVSRELLEFGRDSSDIISDEEDTVMLRCAEDCKKTCQQPNCYRMKQSRSKHWDFLENLTEKDSDSDLLFCHGSPLDPTFEYVIPDRFRSWDPGRVQALFGSVDRLAFCGHTHYPCAVMSNLSCYYPQKDGNRMALEDSMKYIINIGSVGQPRDRDTRSSYLFLDEESGFIEWRRIEYDIEAVVKKVAAMCDLDNWCGERLRRGQ